MGNGTRLYCFAVRPLALLGIIIVIFAVLLATASNLHSVAIAVGVILASGTLFWKLVKAMARIQMPPRPERRR